MEKSSKYWDSSAPNTTVVRRLTLSCGLGNVTPVITPTQSKWAGIHDIILFRTDMYVATVPLRTYEHAAPTAATAWPRCPLPPHLPEPRTPCSRSRRLAWPPLLCWILRPSMGRRRRDGRLRLCGWLGWRRKKDRYAFGRHRCLKHQGTSRGGDDHAGWSSPISGPALPAKRPTEAGVAEAAEEAISACLAAGAAADRAVNWQTGVLPLGGVSTRCGGGAAATVAAVGFDRAARGGIWLSHSTVGRRRHWRAALV